MYNMRYVNNQKQSFRCPRLHTIKYIDHTVYLIINLYNMWWLTGSELKIMSQVCGMWYRYQVRCRPCHRSLWQVVTDTRWDADLVTEVCGKWWLTASEMQTMSQVWGKWWLALEYEVFWTFDYYFPIIIIKSTEKCWPWPFLRWEAFTETKIIRYWEIVEY